MKPPAKVLLMDSLVFTDTVYLYGQAQESNLIHIKHTHCHKQSGYGQEYEERYPCIEIYTITTSYTKPEGQLHTIGSIHFRKT